jgi:hypothetical protein
VSDPALDLLTPEDRATVAGWLDLLGFEVEELDCVPPLRLLVDIVASARTVRRLSPPMGRDAAWAVAGELIGRRGLVRRWYAWQASALSAERTAAGDTLEATATEREQ